MTNQLYDQDLQLWIEQTISQLKNREFDSLDIEHLIEELIDLGKSEKNALKSIQFDAPETMKRSWYSSVIEHRQRVLDNLADTPSLQSFLAEAIEKAYGDGRKLAIKEGKLAKLGVRVPQENEYPLICPFSIEQILDEDFYGV